MVVVRVARFSVVVRMARVLVVVRVARCFLVVHVARVLVVVRVARMLVVARVTRVLVMVRVERCWWWSGWRVFGWWPVWRDLLRLPLLAVPKLHHQHAEVPLAHRGGEGGVPATREELGHRCFRDGRHAEEAPGAVPLVVPRQRVGHEMRHDLDIRGHWSLQPHLQDHVARSSTPAGVRLAQTFPYRGAGERRQNIALGQLPQLHGGCMI